MNSSACSPTFETIDLQLKDANGTESKWSRMWLIVRCFYFSCSCIVGMDRCNLYWRKVHESDAFFFYMCSVCQSMKKWISWRYITLFGTQCLVLLARNGLFIEGRLPACMRCNGRLVPPEGWTPPRGINPTVPGSLRRGDFPVLLLIHPPKN